jgi:hypothetical protein
MATINSSSGPLTMPQWTGDYILANVEILSNFSFLFAVLGIEPRALVQLVLKSNHKYHYHNKH